MNLTNLDDVTRMYMIKEIDLDVREGRLYYSKRLTEKGRADYEELLKESAEKYDAAWLAEQLKQGGRMKGAEVSQSKKGRTFVKRTPYRDHETAAYGEFNRYYVRGLCLRAIDEKIDHLVVYRAKEVHTARYGSTVKIGSQVNPQELLDDLRENIGRDTRLGIPGGPNSGISVRLPEN